MSIWSSGLHQHEPPPPTTSKPRSITNFTYTCPLRPITSNFLVPSFDRESIMAPKKNARDITPTAAATAQASAPAPASASQPKPKKSGDSWDKVLQNIYDHYIQDTPQRTKLIDVFLVFLVAVGALQFLYCVLAGNYVGSGRIMRDTPDTNLHPAFQRFPVWFLGYGWTVCPDGYVFVSGFE